MFIIYALNRNLTYEDLYKELSNNKLDNIILINIGYSNNDNINKPQTLFYHKIQI